MPSAQDRRPLPAMPPPACVRPGRKGFGRLAVPPPHHARIGSRGANPADGVSPRYLRASRPSRMGGGWGGKWTRKGRARSYLLLERGGMELLHQLSDWDTACVRWRVAQDTVARTFGGTERLRSAAAGILVPVCHCVASPRMRGGSGGADKREGRRKRASARERPHPERARFPVPLFDCTPRGLGRVGRRETGLRWPRPTRRTAAESRAAFPRRRCCFGRGAWCGSVCRRSVPHVSRLQAVVAAGVVLVVVVEPWTYERPWRTPARHAALWRRAAWQPRWRPPRAPLTQTACERSYAWRAVVWLMLCASRRH
eukprot:364970-Chlamydomonas_euryale.AAC.1